MPELTYRQAVAAALAQEMARDERVVLLGEDIASGGVFKTTLGLAERFGKKRVRNTPISETAIAGRGDGRGDGRPAAGRGDHVLGLLRRLLGPGGRRDRQGPLHDRRPVRAAAGDPRGQRRRHRLRRPAQPVGRELGAVRARPQDRLARDARRRRRADRRGHPGRRPGAGVRAQGALRQQGRRARRRARAAARRGRRAARGRRRHAGRAVAHRRDVPGRGRPARRGGHLRRGHRPAHARAARHGHGAARGAAHRARRHRRGEPGPAGVGRGDRGDPRRGGVRGPRRAGAAGERRQHPVAGGRAAGGRGVGVDRPHRRRGGEAVGLAGPSG